MTNTRVIRFKQTGGPEVLTLQSEPQEEPGAGQVRVKIEAIGVNQAEAMFRQGYYIETPELPARLGAEAAGIIDAVGPGVEGLRVGDRVLTMPGFNTSRHGVYADSTVLPASTVTTYPAEIPATTVAASWVAYLTVYGALVDYSQIKHGDTVLLTAGTSSVGLAALQVVRAQGARSIATTRDARKRQALLDAGAHEVIVTTEEDLVGRVLKATDGVGARVVFDPIGGSTLEALVAASAKGGTIYEYGMLSGDMAPALPLGLMMIKEVSIRGFSVYELFSNPARLARAKDALFSALSSGTFKPIIAREFPLTEVVAVHKYMASNEQFGKILIKP